MKKVIIWLIIIFLAGGSLVITSFFIPVFSNTIQYENLNKKYSDGIVSQREYIREYESLMSNKFLYKNFGTGLISFSLIIFLFNVVQKVRTFKDYKSIKTFTRRSKYFLLGNIAIFFIITGLLENIFKEDYQVPIYESARAIYGIIPIAIILFLINNIVLLILTYHTRKETYIFGGLWFSKYTGIYEIPFMLTIFILIAFLALFIFLGVLFGIIAILILIFITLSLRAEVLNPLQIKAGPNMPASASRAK